MQWVFLLSRVLILFNILRRIIIILFLSLSLWNWMIESNKYIAAQASFEEHIASLISCSDAIDIKCNLW